MIDLTLYKSTHLETAERVASYPGLPSQLSFAAVEKKSCEGRPGYEATERVLQTRNI